MGIRRPAFIAMLVALCRGAELPDNGQPADGQVLGEGGEGTEEEVKGVLEEDGECGDGRVRGEGWGEGFDVRPGQVDVEEEEEDAEAGDGGLDGYAVSCSFLTDSLEGRAYVKLLVIAREAIEEKMPVDLR